MCESDFDHCLGLVALESEVNFLFLSVFQASLSPPTEGDRSSHSPFQPGPLHSSPLQTPTMSSPQSSTAVSPIREASAYENGHQGRSATGHKTPFEGKVFLHIFGWTDGWTDIFCPPLWLCDSSLFRYPSEYFSTSQIPRKHRRQHSTCEWDRPSRLSQMKLIVSLLTLSLWFWNSFLFPAGPCSTSASKAASSRAGEAARGSGDHAGVKAALQMRRQGRMKKRFSLSIRPNSNLSPVDFCHVWAKRNRCSQWNDLPTRRVKPIFMSITSSDGFNCCFDDAANKKTANTATQTRSER